MNKKVKQEYRTKSGQKVINVHRVAGSGYKVKGNIVLKEEPLRVQEAIWTKEGRYNLFKETDMDLVIKEIS